MAPKNFPLSLKSPSLAASSSEDEDGDGSDSIDSKGLLKSNKPLDSEDGEESDEVEESDEEGEEPGRLPHVSDKKKPQSSLGPESDNDGSDSETESEGMIHSSKASDFTIKPVPSNPTSSSGKNTHTKPDSKRGSESVQNGEDEKKKKRRKKADDHMIAEGMKSPNSSVLFARLWSEDDELAILEGLINYKAKVGGDPTADMGAFLEFIKKSIHVVGVSKAQLSGKIQRLKKRFRNMVSKGKSPVLSKPHNVKLFHLSKKLWGAGTSTDGLKDRKIAGNKSSRKTKVIKNSEFFSQESRRKHKQKDNTKKQDEKAAGGEDPRDDEDDNGGEEDQTPKGVDSKDDEVQVDKAPKGVDSKDDEVQVDKAPKGVYATNDVDEGVNTKEDPIKEIESKDFLSSFPNLRKSLDDLLFESARDVITKNIHLIGSANAESLEEKWKNIHAEQLRLGAKRMVYIGELILKVWK